jgi:hypothetical protein
MLTALALPVAPALAGEDDGSDGSGGSGGSGGGAVSATLSVPRDCVSANRAKATVTGDDVDTVTFFVDGKRIKTASRPAATGRFVFSMRCSRLSVGAHAGRAVVTFAAGSSPATQTLRFQITRSRSSSARFTG